MCEAPGPSWEVPSKGQCLKSGLARRNPPGGLCPPLGAGVAQMASPQTHRDRGQKCATGIRRRPCCNVSRGCRAVMFPLLFPAPWWEEVGDHQMLKGQSGSLPTSVPFPAAWQVVGRLFHAVTSSRADTRLHLYFPARGTWQALRGRWGTSAHVGRGSASSWVPSGEGARTRCLGRPAGPDLVGTACRGGTWAANHPSS